MLKREDVLSLGYLKKAQFRGSYQGMRFLMKKETVKEENVLRVCAWPEPYGFEATEDEKKISKDFAFGEEGIVESVAWLNEVHGQIVK